jgi:hypothetical protein
MVIDLRSAECSPFPIILAVDDTLVDKHGIKFEYYAMLYDHAHHDSKYYIFGHCFVSLVVSVPVYIPGIGRDMDISPTFRSRVDSGCGCQAGRPDL